MGLRGSYTIEIAAIAFLMACTPLRPGIKSQDLVSRACTTSAAHVQSTPKRAIHISRTISAGERLNIVLNKVCMGSSESQGLQAFEIETPTDMTPDDLQAFANDTPCIEEVSESRVWKMESIPNDPYYSQQAHLSNLGYDAGTDVLFAAGGISSTRQIVVAVIDSGVALDHPDLQNRLWENPGEIAGNGLDDDGNGYVDDFNGYNLGSNNGNPRPETWTADPGGEGHGTHVAGLIGAQSNNETGGSGVAGSNIKIMALNIFGTSTGSTSTLAYNAINYAIDNGADVINLSLSSEGEDASIANVVSRAISSGIVVVVAAGNDGRELNSSFFLSPASYGASRAGLITVAASDSGTSSKCSFSNYSTTLVEIAAPGAENLSGSQGLLSTYLGTSYARMAGTSMATPIVAGAAALTMAYLRSRGYNPSPATVESLLTETARFQSGLSQIMGGKHLDLPALAQYLNNNYPNLSGGTSGTTGGDWPPPPCN